MQFRTTVILGSPITVLLLLVSCSPSDALKVFTEKGLVVLQPAKTYVKEGGLFTVGNKGKPAFIDPDPNDPLLNSASARVPDCEEIFGDEDQRQQMAFSVAVSALKGIIPFAGGLQGKSGTNIHLASMTAPCVRLQPRVVPALAGEPTNKPLILAELNKGNRVFVVLEVVSTKSLILSAEKEKALAVSFQGKPVARECSGANGSESKGGQLGTDQKGNGGPGASGSSKDKNGTSNSGKSDVTNSKGADDAKNTGNEKDKKDTSQLAVVKTDTSTGGTNKPGDDTSDGAISACVWLSSTYQLTIQSAKAVPFAVRLTEVAEIRKGSGILDVKYTGFKFPATTLGAGTELEKETAKIDAALLRDGYTHRKR